MGVISTLLKLALYVIVVSTIAAILLNVVVAIAFPVHMNPEMPHALRVIAVGVPLVVLPSAVIGYYFKREMRILKYGLPVAIITPWIVLGVSWVLLIPTYLASFPPTVFAMNIVLPAVIALVVMIDVFTGTISGKPLMERLSGSSMDYSTYREPVVTPTAPAPAPGSVLVGGFQIIESPTDRTTPDTSENTRLWEPAESILRTLMGPSVPLIYRLERIDGVTRELILTLGRGSGKLAHNMSILERALNANLPQYRLQKHVKFSAMSKYSVRGVVECLVGEPLRGDDPQQRQDPLTAVAEALLMQDNAVLQVTALPVSKGITKTLKRMHLGRRYKSEASQAQVSVTSESKGLLSRGKQETAMYTDMMAAEKAEKTRRELDRYSADYACDIEISVASWARDLSIAERDVETLSGIVRGAIKPADVRTDFKIKTKKRDSDFQRLMHGQPIGEYTLMLPVEAAVLFTLPRTDIGTSLVKRHAFPSAVKPVPKSTQRPAAETTVEGVKEGLPRAYAKWEDIHLQRRGLVFLGNTLRPSGDPIAGNIVWFPLQKFESHFGIYGNVRSGKTWTALQIVAQAMKGGLKTTILVPRRARDWTRLIYLHPDLTIFTVGNPSVAPLRINMFVPPKNVPLSIWMKTLVKILSGLLPNDRVMSLHFDDVIETVYRNCGWDKVTGVYGRPILLSDLWDAMEEVSSDLKYGDELKSNFYGALFTRMSSMLRNNTIVDMYNTEEGMNWEFLATNNVLIDMEYLPDEDRSVLMSLLAAGLHRYKMFNPSQKIENLLVLEEASYILKKSDGPDFYGPNANDTVQSLMIDMFTTCGGNGLGTLTIEQLPSRLSDEIVKLIVNVVTHAIGDESERRIIAGHIGIDEKRMDHLQQMRKGETIVYFEGESVPRNVLIWPIDRFLKGALPETIVTPEWTKKHMKGVYERNPCLCSSVDLPSDIIERIHRKAKEVTTTDRGEPAKATAVREQVSETFEYRERIDRKLGEIVKRARFVKHLAERAEQAQADDVEPLARFVIGLAEDLNLEGVETSWVAERLIRHSAECYPALIDSDLTDIMVMVIQGGNR